MFSVFFRVNPQSSHDEANEANLTRRTNEPVGCTPLANAAHAALSVRPELRHSHHHRRRRRRHHHLVSRGAIDGAEA
jgi:hypothetical protein